MPSVMHSLTLALGQRFKCIVGMVWVSYYLAIHLAIVIYVCMVYICAAVVLVLSLQILWKQERKGKEEKNQPGWWIAAGFGHSYTIVWTLTCTKRWTVLRPSPISLQHSAIVDRARTLGHGQLASFNDSVLGLKAGALSCMNSRQAVKRCHLSSH